MIDEPGNVPIFGSIDHIRHLPFGQPAIVIINVGINVIEIAATLTVISAI